MEPPANTLHLDNADWATASLLAFGVVGWEQLLHTGPGGLPLYQVLHWVSDSLLALPIALGAVWAGSRLAARRGRRGRRSTDVFIRAGLTAMVFAVLLVPGGFLHEQIDTLTQSHRVLSLHTHGGLVAARDLRDPAVLAAYVLHGFTDGVLGQAVGLPLLMIALAWIARRRSLATSRARSGAHSTTRMTFAS